MPAGGLCVGVRGLGVADGAGVDGDGVNDDEHVALRGGGAVVGARGEAGVVAEPSIYRECERRGTVGSVLRGVSEEFEAFVRIGEVGSVVGR